MIFYRVYVRYTEVQSVIKINMVKWKVFKSLLLTSGEFKWKLIPQARLESKNKTHNKKKKKDYIIWNMPRYVVRFFWFL